MPPKLSRTIWGLTLKGMGLRKPLEVSNIAQEVHIPWTKPAYDLAKPSSSFQGLGEGTGRRVVPGPGGAVLSAGAVRPCLKLGFRDLGVGTRCKIGVYMMVGFEVNSL